MQTAIGYLRVSTQEQGKSGLGLGAQRRAIETFGSNEDTPIIAWYQDIQTGGGADALLLRPGLASALKHARKARCALIVSRLDRLSRNVHFISGLMEHKAHFVVAALGRDCDNFTLHIYASLAEQERKMVSEAALAVAKAQGRMNSRGSQTLESLVPALHGDVERGEAEGRRRARGAVSCTHRVGAPSAELAWRSYFFS
jgi:DNA invertase Pin-like site-specific DNA recombinase